MEKDSQCHNDLLKYGYFKSTFPITSNIGQWTKDEAWDEIDSYFQKQTSAAGELFQYLKRFEDFESIEFIISLRDGASEWEEDGIWHDDGSRVLAFSLSLKSNHDVLGGNLLFRKKGAQTATVIPPFGFGEIIVFKTGVTGYEHKVERVNAGRRIVVAGWCS